MKLLKLKESFFYILYGLYVEQRERGDKSSVGSVIFLQLLRIVGLASAALTMTVSIIIVFLSGLSQLPLFIRFFFFYCSLSMMVLIYFIVHLNGGFQYLFDGLDDNPQISKFDSKLKAKKFLNRLTFLCILPWLVIMIYFIRRL